MVAKAVNFEITKQSKFFRRVYKCSSEYRVLRVREDPFLMVNYGSLYKLENFEKSCFRSDT